MFFTFGPFNRITTLTYVLMNIFCPCLFDEGLLILNSHCHNKLHYTKFKQGNKKYTKRLSFNSYSRYVKGNYLCIPYFFAFKAILVDFTLSSFFYSSLYCSSIIFCYFYIATSMYLLFLNLLYLI